MMWRTYDDGGWKLLKDGCFLRAKRYFEHAEDYLSKAPQDDCRRGRTLAGFGLDRVSTGAAG